ncbi:MAG: hypothetical protein ACYCZT_09980 [Thiobacillus sp.]
MLFSIERLTELGFPQQVLPSETIAATHTVYYAETLTLFLNQGSFDHSAPPIFRKVDVILRTVSGKHRFVIGMTPKPDHQKSHNLDDPVKAWC